MASITLNAETRSDFGKNLDLVRSKGMVPGVVYGSGVANSSLSVSYIPFEKMYRQAGESSLVDLVIDAKTPLKVLIQEVQKDPVTDKFIHVDFLAVSMTEKLTATIPLKFVGESKAIKGLGGTLVKNMQEVSVRCLPGDLVHEIEVDLSPLETFEDALALKDIKSPRGIEIIGNQDATVATVAAPMTEAELKALDEKPVADVSAVEKVDDKKKKEEATPEK